MVLLNSVKSLTDLIFCAQWMCLAALLLDTRLESLLGMYFSSFVKTQTKLVLTVLCVLVNTE